jgi:integrase/recombinase XerD
MVRTFIAQRGQKKSTVDRQRQHDLQIPDVRYSIHEAVEIFIQAKVAEGLRESPLRVILIL